VNCEETRNLIHGYVDGELDLVRSLAIEQHLHECAACSEAHGGLQSLRAGALYLTSPPSLKRRIQASLRKVDRTRSRTLIAPGRILALAASVAAAVLLTWGSIHFLSTRADEDRLAQLAVSSHVRSFMAPKPFDKESSDRHVLKPWLNDKLGFSPDVADQTAKPGLVEHGFRLEGARIDYLDNRLVAALVYTRDIGATRRLLNFLWPGCGVGGSLAALSRGLGLRRHRAGFLVLFTASWSSSSKAVSIAFSPGLPTHL
jgi:anti-sigma factor RsiW